MVMRGGTSKGAYFLADDLPAAPGERDELLRRIMGSPDPRQIDGIGGAHPLTSKVAIVQRSTLDDIDVDYHFLQVGVDDDTVSDRQHCGNLLAGIAPFSLERGLLPTPDGDAMSVRIHMVNTGATATATFPVAGGCPVYDGDTAIHGVPGTAAPIRLDFDGIAGSSCGALLPTGRTIDEIAGVAATLIDNGMPVVILQARDVGVTGYEPCADLEANQVLCERLERLRLAAGPLMNLGDVSATTVPKLALVAPPRDGGALCTRMFIPHRCHEAIGVLAAVSVSTAALLSDGPACSVAHHDGGPGVTVEHPTGSFTSMVELDIDGDDITVQRAGILRTARKLMDGIVYPRP